MYARQFTFKVGPGKRSEVEAVADQAFAFAKSLRGFVTIHFLISEDENEYGSFSLWESKNDADAAGEAIRANTAEALKKIGTESPTRKVFEVYKPKSK